MTRHEISLDVRVVVIVWKLFGPRGLIKTVMTRRLKGMRRAMLVEQWQSEESDR